MVKVLYLPTNIRLGIKGLQMLNTQAYLLKASITTKMGRYDTKNNDAEDNWLNSDT